MLFHIECFDLTGMLMLRTEALGLKAMYDSKGYCYAG